MIKDCICGRQIYYHYSYDFSRKKFVQTFYRLGKIIDTCPKCFKPLFVKKNSR
jgi:hypothetical protein